MRVIYTSWYLVGLFAVGLYKLSLHVESLMVYLVLFSATVLRRMVEPFPGESPSSCHLDLEEPEFFIS
jgi:hypothetical protein